MLDRIHSVAASLRARYLRQLVATPEGLAFFLGYLASLEKDEVHVFETLLARVPDERFQKLIRIHREDEQRHAEVLERCATSVGPPPLAVPVELNMPYRLEQALCGLTESFMQGTAGVFEVYALLQVLEERAVEQYPLFIRALRTVDTESADVLSGVLEDERRHVGYARAIAREYAPNPAAHARTLACYRAIEAVAFEQQARDFTLFTLDHGLLQPGRIEAAALRALCALGSAREPLEMPRSAWSDESLSSRAKRGTPLVQMPATSTAS